jgi:mannose-6-phosphate isomerase-like protein (cupin superfamily)/DNA-binding Xre family transcriptional regulator
MTEQARPGERLKALRQRKGWRLADVAQKTGFPVSTLSKIETGKVALTYDKIARLSKGLQVDIGVFFTEGAEPPPAAAASGRRSIVRRGDGQVIDAGNYRHRFVATDMLNKRFVPIVGESFARSIGDFGELIRHGGEEFTYVLEGTLELHSELYAPLRLEAGEAIYFDSGMAHAYVDVGETPLKLLTICSGEESQLAPSRPRLRPAEGAPAVRGSLRPGRLRTGRAAAPARA